MNFLNQGPFKGFVLDVDGTLYPDAPRLGLHALAAALAPEAPPLSFLRDYFALATTFDLGQALKLLLSSLGREDSAQDILAAFTSLGAPTLDPGFPAFHAACSRLGLSLAIFSQAGKDAQRFSAFKGFEPSPEIHSPGSGSKANPRSWRDLARALGGSPSDWVCVDDSPLALRAAALAGFRTVLYMNSFFNAADYTGFDNWIGDRISGLAELIKFLPQEPGL